MTNYEREMFNIAVPPDASIESQLKAYTDTNCVDAFKMGHRAARHRAAEIAYDADVHIAELEAQLAAANQRIAELEAERSGNVFTRMDAAINELGRELGIK